MYKGACDVHFGPEFKYTPSSRESVVPLARPVSQLSSEPERFDYGTRLEGASMAQASLEGDTLAPKRDDTLAACPEDTAPADESGVHHPAHVYA